MARLTIEVPDELERELAAAARRRNLTESEVIVELLERHVHKPRRPRPTGALFASGLPDLGSNCDRYLEGFGED